jgi:hypothetical protein
MEEQIRRKINMDREETIDYLMFALFLVGIISASAFIGLCLGG